MKAPAFQLYAADFYMDTASWTCNQVGAYIRLLMYEWINGALPKEISHLSRIAGIDIRNMQKMWSAVLAKKFIIDDANMLVNPRLEREREKQQNYRKSQEESGRRGGKITQEKRRNMESEPSSEPSSENKALQSSSSITTPKPPRGAVDLSLNSYSPLFLNFWSKYPSKVGKGAAWKAWKKIKSPSMMMDTIITAINEQARTEKWKKNNGRYIPNPATWLNQCRWEDETNTEPEITYESAEK